MKIIGHQKTIRFLDRSIAKNKVAHAYVFSGPTGVGKFTVALDFAYKLTGLDPGKISPDLVVMNPETEEKKGVLKKRAIKIEKIRRLQRDMALSGSGGRYRAAIIDDADMLNAAAQNAFLKTLEEPHEKVVLILIVRNEKNILPTILSRCQRIRFGLVPDKELEEELGVSVKNRKEILFWSLGRPGVMRELTENAEALDLRVKSMAELVNLPKKNIAEKFVLAGNFSKDIELAGKKLGFWSVALRESLLGRKIFLALESGKALKLIEEIEKSLELTKNTNSNPKLVLENLFLNF